MTIYAFAHTKGGVAKTTNAVNTAAMLAALGPTLLIDTDPQASAASWAQWRREAGKEPMPTTVRLYGKEIITEGKNLSKNYDNTVIDVGGFDSPHLRSALMLAETVIIPVGASAFESSAMTDITQTIEEAKVFNEGLRVKVLMTRLHTNPNVRDTALMLDFLKENGYDVFNTKLHERLAYRRAVESGLTPEELDDADPERTAAKEFRAFFEELVSNEK